MLHGLPARILALVLAVLAGVAVVLAIRDSADPAGVSRTDVPVPPAARGDAQPFADPFSYDPDERASFERRAAAGTSHGLYASTPGGVQAGAARTARWRPQVERAAKQAGVSADRLEGLILLESAGRPDAMAGNDSNGAVGLTQILAETAQNLLGMRVDVAQSARLTRRIARERRRGRPERVPRLQAQRARVDERFDPGRALTATARYLKLAKQRFGREDLAFVAYHMGIGNLEGVLRAYAGEGAAGDPIGDVVADRKLTYAGVLRLRPAAPRLGVRAVEPPG